MIFHNYFVFELRISKLLIFELVAYSRFIKVFLFIVFATKAQSFFNAEYAKIFRKERNDCFFVEKEKKEHKV